MVDFLQPFMDLASNSQWFVGDRETSLSPLDAALLPVLSNVLLFDPSLSSGATPGLEPASMDLAYDFMGSCMPPDQSQGVPIISAGALNIGETQALSNASEGSDSPAPPESSGSSHVYQPLAPSTLLTVDTWMEPCVHQDKTSFKCTWPNCTVEPLMKSKARAHIHKHLGIDKLFQCECGKQFASLASAKRHSDTQSKRFRCGFCLKPFARKDYRNVHQRKCGSQPSA